MGKRIDPPDGEKYPALFRRWLRSGEGRRWLKSRDGERWLDTAQGAEWLRGRDGLAWARKHAPKRDPAAQIRERYPFNGTKWTTKEDLYLRAHWGEASLPVLAEALGRSPTAISNRATRVLKMPAATKRLGMTLAEFARHSGFNERQIKKGAKALKIPLPRGYVSHVRRDNKGRLQRRTHHRVVRHRDRELLLGWLLEQDFG